MCSSSSPTCVVVSGGLQQQQEIATISSEIPPPPSFFCEGGGAAEGGHAGRCCPSILPAITRSHDITEETTPLSSGGGKKSAGSGRSSGWKTSKFFSRTMSSGEILRGLKKLSLASSTEGSGDSSEVATAARPRKSKSGQQLKKRSSAGNDDAEDDPKARSPGSFRPLSKAMSVSEPGGSSCRSSSSSSLGIVCRKEDLKAILCTAGKKFPLASPSSMRRRHKGASPLRQTKSASFDTQEEKGGCRKEAVRRAGSEETAPGRPPLAPLHLRPSVPPPVAAPLEEPPSSQDPPLLTPAAVDNCQKKEEGKEGGSLSTVKWDECEVVDAVLLGDAIESFLKGSMGGGGGQRAASFRRTSDRKAKSDG